MPRKKKLLKPKLPKQKQSGNSTEFSEVPRDVAAGPVAAIFAGTDAKLAAVEAGASEELPGAPGSIAPAPAPAPFDSDAFLLTGAHQLISQLLVVSKVVGKWNSPAIAGPNGTWLLSEEDWKAAVASSGVQVLQKRWPSLASSITPEFALCALVLPWVLSNLAEPIENAIRGLIAKRKSKSDSNTRENRDGQNVSHAAVA